MVALNQRRHQTRDFRVPGRRVMTPARWHNPKGRHNAHHGKILRKRALHFAQPVVRSLYPHAARLGPDLKHVHMLQIGEILFP